MLASITFLGGQFRQAHRAWSSFWGMDLWYQVRMTSEVWIYVVELLVDGCWLVAGSMTCSIYGQVGDDVAAVLTS